ncbi:uncharacterized protein BP5553_04315 [Venustampulla echinocandica]|uniref:Uncharacterized protein n=1 Tax=Venustampulla echinocandica TaxID=2656787 RepID=A0A370TWS1_9HELO|nr:uncharacterized protein BP5553_04315 [Venustampulla echinocandica]RDL39975.1 hypothetical protein BP5553_04315 [Venustampulla echinocandica]
MTHTDKPPFVPQANWGRWLYYWRAAFVPEPRQSRPAVEAVGRRGAQCDLLLWPSDQETIVRPLGDPHLMPLARPMPMPTPPVTDAPTGCLTCSNLVPRPMPALDGRLQMVDCGSQITCTEVEYTFAAAARCMVQNIQNPT